VSAVPAQGVCEIELVRGATFAGYRIDRVAGAGATGVVYRATRRGLKWPVALKVVAPALCEDDAFRERFQRDAELAAAIGQPNTVRIHEVGDREGRLFLAMRYIPGIDLGTLIEREGPLGVQRAERIVWQVAAALDAAHRRGLVHRDVKPGHMLIAGELDELTLLTDFGVSALGAPDYLAPELVRPGQASVRADVYALGCVLFHALTGRPPFARSTQLATTAGHLSQPPPALSASRGDLPAALDAVIACALSKQPADRPATAAELAAAFHAALHRNASAPPVRRADPPDAPGTNGSPRRDRLRLLVGVALPIALAGAILVGSLAAAGVPGGSDERPPLPAPSRPAPARTTEHTRAPAPVASIPIGKAADGIAAVGDDVWVAAARDNALVHIDARTDRVTARVPAGTDPDSVAAGRRVVWVTSRGDGLLRRFLVRAAPMPAGTVRVGGKPEGIGLGDKRAWVVSAADDTVTRVDRATAATTGGPIAVGAQPIDVSVGPSGVWTANSADGTVSHINPATGRPIGGPIPVGREPKGVTEGLGSVWVANSGDDTVLRLDPRTGRAIGRPIRVGDQPSKLTVAAGLVWVTNFGAGTVSRIDPRNGRVVGTPLRVGRQPVGIAFAAGHVWVASLGDGTVTKIRP
jgi:DNA-binding beta-propeller fold protein YncE